MLKFKIDTVEGLDESVAALYEQSGDVYQLKVEGAVDKSKLDEFRTNNQTLNDQLSKFKGVDLDEWKELQKQKQELADKKLIDAGDIDALIEQRLTTVKSDYENKLTTMQSQLESANTNTSTLLNKYEIEGAASAAIAKNKIKPEMVDAVMALVKSKFVLENGQAVAKEGDQILAGDNGNLTISEFISKQPDAFKISSTGGGAGGSDGNSGGSSNLTGAAKIAAGLKKQR